MFKIALDAGHGMNTPGKRCLKSLDPKETREWFLNDRIADMVEKKLAVYEGYELMRVDDPMGIKDVPLSVRTNVANMWGADFYLSIHADAGIEGGYGGGISSIVYTHASEKSLECQKIIYDELISATSLVGNRVVPLPRQNLQVLRETNMPAVLVECGFMDSATDVPIILTDEFAEKAAEGFVAALVIIGKLTKRKEADVNEKIFLDTKGHFAEKNINELFKMGIVNGKTEERFMPNELITRGEVAAIARRVIRYITGE